MTGADGTLTVLVLAGSRAGHVDPMARDAGVSHKALLPVGGRTMIDRVIGTLRACPQVGRIVVSADAAESLLPLGASRQVILVRPSHASPSRSVAAILDEFGPTLLVTTADHPLLTPEMVAYFVSAAPAGADVVAAVATAPVVQATYPDTRRTWLRLRGCRLTGCNLFLLRTATADAVLAFWQRVERQRKRPLAIARLIGPVALLLYITRTASVTGMLRLLGRRVGAKLAVVEMPFADAAIDVDRPADRILVERVLRQRRADQSGSMVAGDVT